MSLLDYISDIFIISRIILYLPMNRIGFILEDLKKSIEVCKLCAFDKQKDTTLPNIKFSLDPNFKKKFRNIPIKSI